MSAWGRMGAVVAAFILVTAPIAPIVTVPSVSAAGNHSVADTPRELKVQAVDDVGSLEAPERRHESARDRAEQRLNESRQYYRGPIRADEGQLFTKDAEAVQALTRFSNTNASKNATKVSETVLKADNHSAHQELQDAQRLLDERGDEIDNQGILNSMEAHLQNAERAYDRANRTMKDARSSQGREAIRKRAAAIRQLRLTWRQSHFVVERIVDRTNATLPVGVSSDDPVDKPNYSFDGNVSLQITNKVDPVRNESGVVNHTVPVSISSDNPVALDNITATVNGEPARTTNLSGVVVTPNASVPTGAQVPLSEGGNKVRITVSGNDGETEASDVVLLDRDGLNATYENQTLGTDPLDPDSNSSLTSGDKSGNGVVDGREDFDEDNLTTFEELSTGTDPLDADTDGDGLEDGTEVFVTYTDPLVADSDEDGVSDAEEDPDEDGLTNLQEVENGTDPHFADSDLDGLTDPEELELGTDPYNPDTDEDGLVDGEEIEDPFNTDPLDPDTNDNGILDGNETYTSHISNEKASLVVNTTAEGRAAGTVEASVDDSGRFDTPQMQSMSVTPVVNIQSRQNISTAQLTFTYDESDLPTGNESQLAIFRWNESIQGFIPVNSSVNTEANTVSANTTHFSRYVVLDVERWTETVIVPEGSGSGDDDVEEVKPLDVALIMDSSGSMDYNDPDDLRKEAAKRFVGALLEDDRAAVIDFDYFSYLNQSLTTDHVAVNETIDQLDADGGTNIDNGIETALNEFEANSEDSRQKAFVLLTDGVNEHGDNDRVRELSHEAAERNITIYTIGFGGANETLLQDVADITGGEAYFAESADDLPEVFARAASNATSATDSDGDGLSDTVENEGFTNGTLPPTVSQFSTNPENRDTDGDGLEDGEEVGEFIERSHTFTIIVDGESSSRSVAGGQWKINSNPTSQDTDGDGLTDDVETEGWTVETVNQSGGAYHWAPRDGDGSIHVSSNPMKEDSDDDGVTDFDERYQTHTDPSGDVVYGIANSLIPSPIAAVDTQDTDQDGFPDRLEETGIPTKKDGEFEWVETDSLAPDSDGDGLLDSSEFGAEDTKERDIPGTEVKQRFYPMLANPVLEDSDKDGLTDFEEFQIGTDALLEDTDGDGANDFVDERPLTDDSPPEIELEALRAGGYVRIVDDSKVQVEDIEVNPYFEPIRGEGGWRPEQASVAWAPDAENYPDRPKYPTQFAYNIRGIGVLNEQPQKYWVNITDENGNEISHLVGVEQSEVSVKKTAAAVGGYGSVSTSFGFNPVTAAGGILVLSSVYFVGNSWELEVSQEGITEGISLTASEPVGTWENVEVDNTDLGTVNLYPGHVNTVQGITYGSGWAYIQETTGLTQEEIGNILNNGNGISGEYNKEYVIGNVGDKKILLTIIGGTLLTATEIVEDPTGEKVEIDEDNEHPVRDDDGHADSWKEIRETIKNPDKVYQNGKNRLYVKKIDGEWVTVRTYLIDGIYTVGTTGVYNSFKEVEDFLNRKGYPTTPVYD